MLILTFRPLTSILCTFTHPKTKTKTPTIPSGDEDDNQKRKKKQSQSVCCFQQEMYNKNTACAHPKVDADRRARLVLGQPLLVRETKQEAALPHRRVSDEQQLDVDDLLLRRRRCHDKDRAECVVVVVVVAVVVSGR